MKITLSVIKADIGSIGGHTGDDIAILMTHRHGEGDAAIHKLAWAGITEKLGALERRFVARARETRSPAAA